MVRRTYPKRFGKPRAEERFGSAWSEFVREQHETTTAFAAWVPGVVALDADACIVPASTLRLVRHADAMYGSWNSTWPTHWHSGTYIA